MKYNINAGTTVMASKDENATESVLVHASGRNILPSSASTNNTGRNETAMMSSEKNSAGPTCLAASIKIRVRLCLVTSPASERCRYPVSTMTMEASISTTIASENPPNDMLLLRMCRKYIGMNAARSATGKVRMGMSADLKWKRNAMVTKLTTTHSSSKSRWRVLMDSLISPERSYPACTS